MRMFNLLNDEFHRVIFVVKNNTRHQRLVQWDSIKCNTKIHIIHNK